MSVPTHEVIVDVYRNAVETKDFVAAEALLNEHPLILRRIGLTRRWVKKWKRTGHKIHPTVLAQYKKAEEVPPGNFLAQYKLENVSFLADPIDKTETYTMAKMAASTVTAVPARVTMRLKVKFKVEGFGVCTWAILKEQNDDIAVYRLQKTRIPDTQLCECPRHACETECDSCTLVGRELRPVEIDGLVPEGAIVCSARRYYKCHRLRDDVTHVYCFKHQDEDDFEDIRIGARMDRRKQSRAAAAILPCYNDVVFTAEIACPETVNIAQIRSL